jgi:hypothetical protein
MEPVRARFFDPARRQIRSRSKPTAELSTLPKKLHSIPTTAYRQNRTTRIRPPAKLADEMTAARQAESSTGWQTEFPGTSHLITTLRGCLIRADSHRRQAQAAFDQLQTVLDVTGLPMLHWKRPIHRLYDRFCRQKSKAERDFFRALRVLKSLFTKHPKFSSPTEPTAYPKFETFPAPARTYRDHGSKTRNDQQQQFNRTANRRR